LRNPKPKRFTRIGTVSRILRMLKLPDGRVKALVQGIAKAKIVKYVRKRSVFRVKIDIIEEPESSAKLIWKPRR
jgi:ATP-dependent Lon protease